ncbi:Kinase suppressor of Ras 1 [Hypsibius exemplaris]|uniref:Kinase suppressor of Ras 1 n=1 Tax=Hypsibius exemplaris TaxID=2072580 RepID=A0A1W0WUB1_HYPEX|nr:Kinase suppressor of Ras 1 [Hypsibius exemplaris]
MDTPTHNANTPLAVLRKFEDLLLAKLEFSTQLQSLVDTSAQSLDAFRTHCSTSRELIKDEIRMLEGKLIQRIGRQLAVRRILTKHFHQLSQDFELSQYLETDLDSFLAEQNEALASHHRLSSSESSVATQVSTAPTETGESAIACLVDRIKLILDEELSQHPSLKQWLEIVGLQPLCVKAIMQIVNSVEDLLQTSESKLKAEIVAVSGCCSCPGADGSVPDPKQQREHRLVPDSQSEDLPRKEMTGLRVEQMLKDKGKLPIPIREDVRRLITACRLLRIYTDRLMAEDNDMKELLLFIPTQTSSAFPSSPNNNNVPTINSTVLATPPHGLVRKESVKSLYWDSWRGRPVVSSPGHAPDISNVLTTNGPFCYVHYAGMERGDHQRDERLPSMLSSFSSEDNFLSSPSTTSQSMYQIPTTSVTNANSSSNNSNYNNNSTGSNRLTSQSSVMSSVSTATTTGDEAETGSAFNDFASASSSCANSVFPSSNNILQMVQMSESSPGSNKKHYSSTGTEDRCSRSPALIFPLSGSTTTSDTTTTVIRPSSSTPSLLLTGNPAGAARPFSGIAASKLSAGGGTVTYDPAGSQGHATRKELLKFTKSTSLESSFRNRLNSDDAVMLTPPTPVDRSMLYHSGSSDSGSSSSRLTSAKGLERNLRRMHHSIHHVFKNHLFLTHTICAYCEKTLRGLGRKCRHCRFRCHPDCADKAPPSCGLPDGLVKEYFKTMNPGKKFRPRLAGQPTNGRASMDEDVTQVEEDDETLSDWKQRKGSCDVGDGYRRYGTLSRASEEENEQSMSNWKPKFRLFQPKTPSVQAVASPITARKPLKKQRSRSTGNCLEDSPQQLNNVSPPSPIVVKSPSHQTALPAAELRSPVARRISGSFSLPRDRRKRKNNLVIPKTDGGGQSDRPVQPREVRLFSDPSPMDTFTYGGGDKRRTTSTSSNLEAPSPPPHNKSQDSLSAQSSSLGSSTPASVPPSPGGVSYNRSGSSSTNPPISPLALTSFVNPRTYRSFMRNVRDQIKSHFHWPNHQASHSHMEESTSTSKVTANASTPTSVLNAPSTPMGGRKTPLFGRRTSWKNNSDRINNNNAVSVEEEAEANRLEAEDSFPSEAPRGFATVLVQPHGSADVVRKLQLSAGGAGGSSDSLSRQNRRFSLLEPQEEVDMIPPIASPPALKIPAVEVDEETELSYSSEVSGDVSYMVESQAPWRRQQSMYLKELNIPYEQIVFADTDKDKPLGQGTFGQVHRGQWHGDVAIKILNDDYLYNDAEELHEAFKQDLATLRKTRHDNLVLFMGACMKQSHESHQQIIITSLLARGQQAGPSAGNSITLHDLIHEQRSKTSLSAPYKAQLNRLLIIASQISQGMGYLHRRGIVHKNLKTKNVFVTHEKCIITDYGLFSISKMYQQGRSDDLLWFPKNWLCYLAPELCRHLQTPRQQKLAFRAYRASNDAKLTFGVPFSIFSDVYAFGTVLYELCTGAFPLLWSASNALRLTNNTSVPSITGGTMTGAETPITPGPGMLPQTPVALGGASMRLPRPADPNLPGSLEVALYMIASGTHPIFKTFRPRGNTASSTSTSHQGPRSGSSSSSIPPAAATAARNLKNATSSSTTPPQSLALTPGTPPTPAHSPISLLSPSIDEAAARELIELISVCWSTKLSARKEFQDIYAMLERVPKKSLARSPSHPVHGNASFPKETIYY